MFLFLLLCVSYWLTYTLPKHLCIPRNGLLFFFWGVPRNTNRCKPVYEIIIKTSSCAKNQLANLNWSLVSNCFITLKIWVDTQVNIYCLLVCCFYVFWELERARCGDVGLVQQYQWLLHTYRHAKQMKKSSVFLLSLGPFLFYLTITMTSNYFKTKAKRGSESRNETKFLWLSFFRETQKKIFFFFKLTVFAHTMKVIWF